MITKELITSMQNNRPVYYMGDCYDIMDCKEIAGSDVAIVQRRSLSNRYSPVEIEPRYLSLGANDV